MSDNKATFDDATQTSYDRNPIEKQWDKHTAKSGLIFLELGIENRQHTHCKRILWPTLQHVISKMKQTERNVM